MCSRPWKLSTQPVTISLPYLTSIRPLQKSASPLAYAHKVNTAHVVRDTIPISNLPASKLPYLAAVLHPTLPISKSLRCDMHTHDPSASGMGGRS
ncbi:hypothetical protein CC80DRAFT_487697 [Byssothecium circinans]|uniref:Uncharacterized protein n=1 Tax=Byssothecium circinans TaxID=147558 RepID=A0A6A5UGW0_9PLEO|nr:hypothetical protein CC80DRAFT_487697 [Byssothecium circinans]